MTDLERLWDDLPVGKPPMDKLKRDIRRAEMLAAAEEMTEQRAERRHRFVFRPLLTAGIATGVVGAFLVGTTVDGGLGFGGGGPGGDRPGSEHLPSHAAFQADLPTAANCDELLDAYIERGLDRVTADGWWADEIYYADDGRLEYYGADRDVMTDLAEGSSQLRNYRAPKAGTNRQTNSDTGTNVQETGVDEPDVVKTDGSVLARIRDDELVLYDVTGEQTERLGSLDLEGTEDAEILLAGDTIVVVGLDEEADRAATPYGHGQRTGTRVLTVDIGEPSSPEINDVVTYDARLLSARQHGDAIRLVMSSGLPDLDFTDPGGSTSREEALDKNREVVEDSTIEDWLPTITSGGESEQLLDCTAVAIPSDELALDTVSVVGFDATDAADPEAIGLAGATDIAYESTERLYLVASPAWSEACFECIGSRWAPSVDGGTSYLFDFALDGISATHVASGEVEGAIADRWSMDEVDGVLRVAVGRTSETGNFNSVVTIERDGQDLVELGRVDRLGVDEDIESVRWFDGLAIVVTFRQRDPLYSIDLTDPASPDLLGTLKIPGFSAYLHPLGADRLVGIGEGPGPAGGWGGQAGLFDVTDLRDVKRVDVQVFGSGSEALAGVDPRTFTWLPGERTILTVVSKWRGSREGYIAVMRLEGGEFETELVRAEYGDDVDQLRTVPLPDGRVVLVTGEDVRFFEV